MNPISHITELFERFPGIGPRQARRFVQYLLTQPHSTRTQLAQAVKALEREVSQCKECYRYFAKNSQASTLCEICADPRRTRTVMFVVEKEADIEVVERSGYRGLYFVLGGTITLGSEEYDKHIRLEELTVRIKREIESKALTEVILGLSATSEGDHTRLILVEYIQAMCDTLPHSSQVLKITSLGRGLSTGSELEYVDTDTISNALKTRT